MRYLFPVLVAAAVLSGSRSDASVFTFTTDPFAGSTAPATPGRQVVGGESSITFDVATDTFVFSESVFGITDPLSFANGTAASLPTSGVEVVVLEEFGPPMNAGLAANLIAARVTSPGPGVFVYFNTGLGLARLVYSPNLDDETSDLKILARMTNITDPATLATFTSANFDTVPEPTAAVLAALGLAAVARRRTRRFLR